MASDLATCIEKWFAGHSDDGEFVCHTRAVPYSVIGPSTAATWIIFATKPVIVSAALDRCSVPEDLGVVGRYGLPSRLDVSWISGLVGSRDLFFLGDMDPVDLMIFAWLRLRLGHIAYLGVSDTLLAELQISSSELPAVRCTQSEQECRSVLKKVLPYLETTIGPQCAKVLERGYKIEFDAVVSAEQADACDLSEALTRIRKSRRADFDT